MGSLGTYHAKRRFSDTPEPKGTIGPKSGEPLQFVVQKHEATRLHFDFRLELNGVLVSWAVTRGPSADPSEKRLAVRTEDHPLDYGNFEGTIPEGNYGAGSVMLWDTGTWEPLHDPVEGLKAGKLHFLLRGARMRGLWVLVRMRGRPAEKGRENWLLIKDRDDQATDKPDGLTNTYKTSVTTGLTMKAIGSGKPAGTAGRTKRNPAFVPPQLATLETTVPVGKPWLYEVKMDGYRGQISIGRDGVRIFTRSGLDWTERFASLVPAAEMLPCQSALIDGEIITEAGGFSALQGALKTGQPLLCYAFDLLNLDGRDMTTRPFHVRRTVLERLFTGLPERSVLRLSPTVGEAGAEFLDDVCASGGEGIVAKRRDAKYVSGRGSSWVKVKCRHQAEFVILGYQPSDKRGRPFASLLMGSYERGVLIYRGKVGSGLDEAAFTDLVPKLGALKGAKAHPEAPVEDTRGAHWIQPKLVAEVSFAEYTGDGRIRHGVFVALREDKAAEDVSAEGLPDPDGKEPAAMDAKERVAGVAISSASRLVFPKDKVTKGDLARYYETVGETMLKTLANRPLALLRHPDGIGRKGFFQKHRGDGFPSQVRTATAPDGEDFMYVASVAGIVGSVQMGAIEFHVRGTRRDRLDLPDRIVFDLDPDEAVSFADLVAAATDIRDLLGGIGLATEAMVTGGKGIHIIAPLQRRSPQEVVTNFARAFAGVLADREPDRFTATMSKAARTGRIFVDWLRNQTEATAVCPWSVRARPGARVAVPVGWDELARLKSARDFGLSGAIERASAPLADVQSGSISQKIVAALSKLAEGK